MSKAQVSRSLDRPTVTSQLVFAFATLAILSVAGCSSSAKNEAAEEESSYLKPISIIYGRAGGAHNPPSDEAKFKQFVDFQMKSMFRAIEYDSIDQLFTSTRDQQPFVILYGKREKGTNPEVVGFEREGVDGKRMVGYMIGKVELVDEAKLTELVPNWQSL